MLTECMDEIQEEQGPDAETNTDCKDQMPSYDQTSETGLLKQIQNKHRFLNGLKPLPVKSGFVKLKSSTLLPSPSTKFKQLAEGKDEISRSVPTPAHSISTKHFRIPFLKDIKWGSIVALSKDWLRNPINLALFVWIICVAISGAILFMVMTRMLNHVLPRKSQRDSWFEVNNQILNALFTLMCLYQHPIRFYHLVLLCRWQPKDILRLRKEYCKHGTYKPNEWMHMMVVVSLLHLNCFAQYALCGLNLGYRRSERPAIGVGLCISVSFGAAAFASVYNTLSPLGREYETEVDQETQSQVVSTDRKPPSGLRMKSFEKLYSFMMRDDNRSPECRPVWIGGLFDLWDNVTLAYLSLCCSCCVFGWNMERLGFGNMFVHIATFLLFCLAPFFIFNLAAINIDNAAVREALGFTGILLCVFGLLYGGFWRIQMRKRYNLPAYNFCCHNPEASDCFQWLCCYACSLAQEVRTADFYDIQEDKLKLKQGGENGQHDLYPLRREEGMHLFISTPSSPYKGKHGTPCEGNSSTPSSPYSGKLNSSPVASSSIPISPFNRKLGSPYAESSQSPSRFSVDRDLEMLLENSIAMGQRNVMNPPVQSVIERRNGQEP